MIGYGVRVLVGLKNGWFLSLVAGVCWLAGSSAQAVNDVGGTLITLTDSFTAPNGAVSWFEDERAIIDDTDPSNTKLLVSSVSSAASGGERGDVDLLWVNLDTGVQGEFELNDRLERPDDHNSAALWTRPDGRYLAMYSTHNNDNFSRYRISTNPGDPTSWSPEIAINNRAATTYSNVYHLPADRGGLGRTYNLTRATNFDPTILISEDEGSSWTSSGYKLVTEEGTSQRPYARYASGGDKIHVTVTENHPRNNDNGIYHAYIQDGQLFGSTGTLLDPNLFNGSALRPNQLTPVLSPGTTIDGTTLGHAWTTDVSIDAAGNPLTVFTARANGDPENDHRFLYARFNGSGWSVNQLAKAGGRLDDPTEPDYTGLASIDPNDPNTVFISTDIDPRNDQPTEHYEIFRGITDDAGDTWDWAPITFNSTADNIRPMVPEWNTEETALVWMRGTYNTFLNYSTEIVAVADIVPLDIQAPRIPADLDEDGFVTVADYELLVGNLHMDISFLTTNQSALLGDFNADLLIDYSDLLAFRDEFNLRNGSRALELSLAVPEPSSLMLLSIVAGLAIRRGER